SVFVDILRLTDCVEMLKHRSEKNLVSSRINRFMKSSTSVRHSIRERNGTWHFQILNKPTPLKTQSRSTIDILRMSHTASSSTNNLKLLMLRNGCAYEYIPANVFRHK